MQLLLALVFIVIFSFSAAAQRATGGDMNAASWGMILWIVLMIVVAVGLVAVAMFGFRSKTRE